jgi:hypothetical protein
LTRTTIGFNLKKKAKDKKEVEKMEGWVIRQGCKGVYRTKVDVRIPFWVKEELERESRKQGMSVSDLVRLYIEKGLAEGKKLKGLG